MEEDKPEIIEITSDNEDDGEISSSVDDSSNTNMKENDRIEKNSEEKGKEEKQTKNGNEDDEKDEDMERPEDLFESEDEEEKLNFTNPAYVPPVKKDVPRPKAIFDPNIVGLIGFLLSLGHIFIIREVRPLLEARGVTLTVDISTTVLLLASVWTFTSNLEGWTRFPFITIVFFISGLIGPFLTTVLIYDPFLAGIEVGVFYNMIIYGPILYILFSVVFAYVNGRNEVNHAFDTGYF